MEVELKETSMLKQESLAWPERAKAEALGVEE